MKTVFSVSAEFKFCLSADTVGVWSMQNKQRSRQCLVKNTAKRKFGWTLNLRYRMCTDAPSPQKKKMGEGDVFESLSLIVFRFPECGGKPLIGCNVNATM